MPVLLFVRAKVSGEARPMFEPCLLLLHGLIKGRFDKRTLNTKIKNILGGGSRAPNVEKVRKYPKISFFLSNFETAI